MERELFGAFDSSGIVMRLRPVILGAKMNLIWKDQGKSKSTLSSESSKPTRFCTTASPHETPQKSKQTHKFTPPHPLLVSGPRGTNPPKFVVPPHGRHCRGGPTCGGGCKIGVWSSQGCPKAPTASLECLNWRHMQQVILKHILAAMLCENARVMCLRGFLCLSRWFSATEYISAECALMAPHLMGFPLWEWVCAHFSPVCRPEDWPPCLSHGSGWVAPPIRLTHLEPFTENLKNCCL